MHALARPHAVITSCPKFVAHGLEKDRVKHAQYLLGSLADMVRGVGGNIGKLLGAFLGVVAHNSTFIAVYSGLVLWGDGDGIASSSWASVGVGVVPIVVVAVGVAVVIVVASGLRGSSVVVVVIGAISLRRWPVVWGESSEE
ncbi:hypothetical protein QYE76_049087 [Lolium multiflorum]|uniref:Uncharacterized protein n=1 Tax=Lolium multiflorum TaxID=4521 RepID=A0AAD8SMA8_LOLMU|nr:hypothetical protein QYE76_049087 [Lolium multiflorum]